MRKISERPRRENRRHDDRHSSDEDDDEDDEDDDDVDDDEEADQGNHRKRAATTTIHGICRDEVIKHELHRYFPVSDLPFSTSILGVIGKRTSNGSALNRCTIAI